MALRLYIAVVAAVGIAWLAYLAPGVDWTASTLGEMGLLVLLMVLAGSFPLPVGPRVKADVTTAVWFSAAPLLDPGGSGSHGRGGSGHLHGAYTVLGAAAPAALVQVPLQRRTGRLADACYLDAVPLPGSGRRSDHPGSGPGGGRDVPGEYEPGVGCCEPPAEGERPEHLVEGHKREWADRSRIPWPSYWGGWKVWRTVLRRGLGPDTTWTPRCRQAGE